MDGFMKVYTNINNLYEFISGNEGYGYSRESENGYWHMEISIPVDRIIISEPQTKDGSNYMIKWKKTIKL